MTVRVLEFAQFKEKYIEEKFVYSKYGRYFPIHFHMEVGDNEVSFCIVHLVNDRLTSYSIQITVEITNDEQFREMVDYLQTEADRLKTVLDKKIDKVLFFREDKRG